MRHFVISLEKRLHLDFIQQLKTRASSTVAKKPIKNTGIKKKQSESDEKISPDNTSTKKEIEELVKFFETAEAAKRCHYQKNINDLKSSIDLSYKYKYLF